MVIDADHAAGPVTGPGPQHRHVKCAYEDVLFVLDEDYLAQEIRESNDVPDRCINLELSNKTNNEMLPLVDDFC